ncbi:hypothetical protein [Sphingomonas sp. 66-10]|uniref:hypothetical protein n=1 Tax=Sphingomonas sp. 66-10 TaxID=1895848 RepID=UPI00257A7FBD|nr:hypothetical protein [Sphingomonas sp. 66-10]
MRLSSRFARRLAGRQGVTLGFESGHRRPLPDERRTGLGSGLPDALELFGSGGGGHVGDDLVEHDMSGVERSTRTWPNDPDIPIMGGKIEYAI